MGYIHIGNLYKDQEILLFKECYALEKIHGCLQKDQKVYIKNKGYIPIFLVEIGDLILSYNEKNNIFEFSKVLKKIIQNSTMGNPNVEWSRG